jgi:hypothetical protein
VDWRIFGLIAMVMEFCTESVAETEPAAWERGQPPASLILVLATLRQFLRLGTPCRELKATPERVNGATLRRRLAEWDRSGLLAQVHAVLVAMLRGNPVLLLDACSARAKRGGELTGPNPTDRGKRGTKYHLAVTDDELPVAALAIAANLLDTVLFERLFLMAFAVLARIKAVFADKGYDAEANRALCRAFGVEPCIGCRGQPQASGLGSRRCPTERSGGFGGRGWQTSGKLPKNVHGLFAPSLDSAHQRSPVDIVSHSAANF